MMPVLLCLHHYEHINDACTIMGISTMPARLWVYQRCLHYYGYVDDACSGTRPYTTSPTLNHIEICLNCPKVWEKMEVFEKAFVHFDVEKVHRSGLGLRLDVQSRGT